MSRSPIFRRITLTEVKKTTNRRGSLLRELAGLEREEKEIIKNHHDPSYSNWRASFLREEGMTTDGFMQTQLKGEGDTDLATIEGNVASSYEAYEGGSDALSNTAITSSGTGSGTDGGFDLGEDYLGFNGDSTPRYAALKPIDASKFDTIVVTGIRGNDNNGGEDPDEENEDLMVYYQLPGQNTIQRLDVSGGVTQSGIDYKIIPVGSDDSGLKEWSLTLPSYTRAANVRFILYQPSHHGTGFDNYGITQINYRRVKPISVMVSLDSPEASSFIRVGSPSKASESKKQREKQLREQLEATKDYTDKKFGENFPGSEVAAPGEEDPTEVEKKAPGLGEFEPEVVDYNTWKQETKKEDPKAQTTEKEYEKWKDDKRLKSFAAVRDAQAEKPAASAPAATSDKKDFDTFKDDSTPQSGMQLDKLVPKGDDTEENDKQQLNLLKSVEKGITDTLMNPLKSKTESGVNNAAMYNATLAGSLATSMITGLEGNIKITTQGAENMASHLNAKELAKVVTFDTTTPTDAENTLNPVGKTDQVLKGSLWGIQGGSTFNVNLETGMLEVVSNKTIRTTSGGESVTRNADGKIVRFTDIPEPEVEDVEGVVRQLLDNPTFNKFYNALADAHKFVTGNRETYQNAGVRNAWEMLKSDKGEYDKFVDFVTKIAEPSGTLIADTVQGVASNAYAVRQALIKLGFPQSDIEKMGGAVGQVSSVAEIPLDDLKKINPEAYDAIMKKAKEDGYTLGADGKLTKPEPQPQQQRPNQLYNDLSALAETEPERVDLLMQRVMDNPQYVKMMKEIDTLRDLVRNENYIEKREQETVKQALTGTEYTFFKGDMKSKDPRLKSVIDKYNAASNAYRKDFDFRNKYAGTSRLVNLKTNTMGLFQKFVDAAAAVTKEVEKLKKEDEKKYKDLLNKSISLFDRLLYDEFYGPQGRPAGIFRSNQKKPSPVLDRETGTPSPRTPPKLDRGGSDALPPPEGFPDPKKDPDAYQDFDLSKKDPLDGTQLAGAPSSRVGAGLPTGRGTNRGQAGDGGSITTDSDFGKRMRDAVLGLGNIQAKTSQKDFGSIAQAYGGQGVDAATLASTAAATQTKKKKKDIIPMNPNKWSLQTASYKAKGSMITEKRKLKSPHDWFNPDDIKPEYPKDPPPEMVDGKWHPDLVDSSKTAERFNKLDPASAKAMPKQDDPNIDAKVEKAKNNPDKDGPGWHKQVSDKIRKARAQQRKG